MKFQTLITAIFLVLVMSIECPCQETSSLVFSQNITAQDDSAGPTIEWPETNGSLAIVHDGAYTGQTEEVWKHEIWVNDTDGVSVVIFMYRWNGEERWMNKTANLIEGNKTRGLYQANFTYGVWWNFIEGHPETEGSGGNFFFKVWANDTLGYWSETIPIHYMGGLLLMAPPIHYTLLSLPVLIPLLVVTTVVTALIVSIRRKRQSKP
jgi:hypothetical protein